MSWELWIFCILIWFVSDNINSHIVEYAVHIAHQLKHEGRCLQICWLGPGFRAMKGCHVLVSSFIARDLNPASISLTFYHMIS